MVYADLARDGAWPLCGTKDTDKEMCLSLSVSSLVDLASAKNNYMKEPNCMSKISDGEVVRSAHWTSGGWWKKRSTLSH